MSLFCAHVAALALMIYQGKDAGVPRAEAGSRVAQISDARERNYAELIVVTAYGGSTSVPPDMIALQTKLACETSPPLYILVETIDDTHRPVLHRDWDYDDERPAGP